MTTIKISNVNPGDRRTAQKYFQPVSVGEDVLKQIELQVSKVANATQLIDHLKLFSQSKSVEEQVSVVKQLCKEVLSISQDEIKQWYITAMLKLYFLSPFKHPVKSAVSGSLMTMSSVHSAEISSCSWRVIKESLSESNGNPDINNLKIVVGNLYTYFSDLHMKPADEHAIQLLQFLNFTLQFCCSELRVKSSTLSADLCDLLLSTSMVLVSVLGSIKTCNKFDKNKKALQVSFTLSETLFNDSDLPYDILCNFGLAIVLIMDIRSNQEWLQIFYDENRQHVQLSEDVQRLCICHGLLSGLPQGSWLLNYPGESENFLSRVLHELLKIRDRADNNGIIILGVSRTILKAVTVPGSPSLISNDMLDKILSLIWRQLDHYTDTVRHVTQLILEVILSLHKAFLEKGIDLSEKVGQAMQSFSKMGRSRYTCLSVMAKHLGCTAVFHQVPNFIRDLTDSLLNPIISSHASDALVALMTAHQASSEETWIATWLPPLLAILSKPSTEAHNVENVLTVAFKLCPQVAISVFHEATRNWEDVKQLSVIIMCLKIGRKLGIGSITSLYDHLTDEQQKHEVWTGEVPLFEVLKLALTHEHDTIRSSALSVIVETRRSTEPLYEKELLLIKEFLKYNINYDVPSARQNGLALFQKVLLRIKLNACTIQHKIQEKKLSKVYNEYQNFLNWLQSFCFNNLFVGANFSRRCWALKILNCCKDLSKFDSSSKLHWNNVFLEPQNSRTLMDVVLVDTFEENKKMATDLLMSLPKEYVENCSLKDSVKTQSLFERGYLLALSNRPSDTVAAAYILQLALLFEDMRATCPAGSKISLDCCGKEDSILVLTRQLLLLLEEQLKTAQVNIYLAASKGPMYGTLFCIRKILQSCNYSNLGNFKAWNDLINDLIELSFRVNAAVVGIVNSSSPEGHLPMDFGKDMNKGLEEAGEPKVTAQMILLCSWRTVKEISLLFGELSERCPIRPKNASSEDTGILNESTLRLIGNHFLTLMEETKHRGAFEQAAVGFRLLVARLWRYTGGDAGEWPVEWLNEILNMIQSTSTVHKLCATRRSAGIPFMVQALVGTEPLVSRNRPYLNSTMLTLLELAGPTTEHREQRTHAFNILRALFRDACLGEFVLPYIEQGFIVAIKGFQCKTWSERNSATLLFSALMTRVFGVRRSRGKLSSRNKMTSYTFFQNYPKLYSYLLKEIEVAGGSLDSPTSPDVATLHPVLLVLGRLYPSTLEGLNTTVQLSMFVPWVRLCASCCVYKTRCLAAEAIVPLIAINAYQHFIIGLFCDIASLREENSIHGLLLQCISLLQSASRTNIKPSDDMVESFSKCIKLLDGTHSPMVELSFLQIAELILQGTPNHLSAFAPLSDKIYTRLTSLEGSNRLGKSLSDAQAARILLELQVILQSDRTDLVSALISHVVPEVTKEAILFVFYLLLDVEDDSLSEEFDDEDEGVNDVLNNSFHGDKPWPLKLPLDKRKQFRRKLDKDQLSALLAQSILDVEKNSDFQEIRFKLSALSKLPDEVWSSRKLVDKILIFLDHPQESVKRAALSCVCSYWKFLRKADEYATCDSKMTGTVCNALLKFSAVESCLGNRMASALFLEEHKEALLRKIPFLEDLNVCVLWTCAIRLVMDDDINVRQAAVKISMENPFLASRAQEKMVENFVSVFGKSDPSCQATLFLWALGSVLGFIDEDADLEEDRVFDKGEMNTYSEEEILTDLVLNYVDIDVIKNLSKDYVQWIYWILFDELPSDDLELKSALSIFNVIHRKILNVQERKSLHHEINAVSRRLEKILEIVFRGVLEI